MSTADQVRDDDAFRVISEHQGPVAIVRAAGEVDIANAKVLEKAIRSAFHTDAEAVLLDLGEVSFLDSTGLCVLLAATKLSSANGNRLRLVRLSPAVTRVIEGAGLEGAFPLVD